MNRATKLLAACTVAFGMAVSSGPIAGAVANNETAQQAAPAAAQAQAAPQDAAPSPAMIALPAGTKVDLGAVGRVNGHTLNFALVNPETGQVIHPGDVTASWTVGLGWYIYVYLNRGDYFWLLGLGYTAASAAICATIAPTIGPAIACAVVAYIIWSVVTSYSPPWYGQCMEIKINYGGWLSGVKFVTRNC